MRSLVSTVFVSVGANMLLERENLNDCIGRKSIGGSERPEMETAFQNTSTSLCGSVFKIAKSPSPSGARATIGDGGGGVIDAISVFKGAIIVGNSVVLGFRVSFETRIFLEVRRRTMESAGPRLSGSPVANTPSSMIRLLVISRDVEPVFVFGLRVVLEVFAFVEVRSIEELLDILEEINIAILVLVPVSKCW